MLAMLSGSAVMPSLLIFYYFYAKDRNPEPRGLLLRVFFAGVVVTIIDIIVVGIYADAVPNNPYFKAFADAAIPEEILKLAPLMLFVWKHKDFDERIDGAIYGMTASLGFATLENVGYVTSHGIENAIVRAVSAVPLHASLGVIVGTFVARARFGAPNLRGITILRGLIAAIILHGMYDGFLFSDSDKLWALPVLAFTLWWARNLIHQERTQQAAEMRVAGMIIPDDPVIGVGAYVKLIIGGIGLTACSLCYIGLMHSEADQVGIVGAAIIFAIPSVLMFLLFRSGLAALRHA